MIFHDLSFINLTLLIDLFIPRSTRRYNDDMNRNSSYDCDSN